MTLGEWVPSQQRVDNSRAFVPLCQALAEQMSIYSVNAGEWDIPLAYDGIHFREQGPNVFAAGLLEELK